MSMMNARAAAARGAALLDERKPGWMDHISPRNLDVASTHWCVLGQIYGSYVVGVLALEIDNSHQVRRYGFCADVNANSSFSYPEINEAWCELLMARIAKLKEEQESTPTRKDMILVA